MFILAAVLVMLLRCLEATSCNGGSCHGDVGNLASGRTVSVSSTCHHGDESRHALYCHYEDGNCGKPRCSRCRHGARRLSHPASHMVDSPFSRSRTYWQSELIGTDDEKVAIQFDLETTFYFTHLIMVFKTPRPGAMVLERSVDFGETWQVYQRYARECRKTFGMVNDEQNVNDCTENYSSEEPCSGGEVIYRVLNPVDSINDPYSAESKHLLKVTNIRIQMWMPQLCSKCNVSEENAMKFRQFAVYDLIIRGTCFCNGHADSCVAFENSQLNIRRSRQAVVHGKCICEHNTKGHHCEKCMPLYNDAPWRPGNGYSGEANACKRCSCHGHAESCHFDEGIWALTGQSSGGVCDNCKHNTSGRRCDRCKVHYFRRAGTELTDPDVCEECNCHVNGTIAIDQPDQHGNLVSVAMPCDLRSGQCHCKFGVTGRRCDRCRKGYWGFSRQGCRRCSCSIGVCDQVSGQCLSEYDDEFLVPVIYRPSITERISRLPAEANMYSLFQLPEVDLHEKMAASYRRPSLCICKEKDLGTIQEFCSKKYNYALKVRVLGAQDDGETTVVSVAIRRIIKQGLVKIIKGKRFIYPESWSTMGCTCPALIPGHDYLVVGHEDRESNRLVVNMDSIVKRWNRKVRQSSRSIHSQCT